MIDTILMWYLGLGVFLQVFIASILFLFGLVFSCFGWSIIDNFCDLFLDNGWLVAVWIIVFFSLFLSSGVFVVIRISFILGVV